MCVPTPQKTTQQNNEKQARTSNKEWKSQL